MVQKIKKVSKKKKRLIAIVIAFLLLVTAACYTVFIAPLLKKEEWVYKETEVLRGTLTVGVTESGALEYGTSKVMYELDIDVGDDEDDEDDSSTVQRYLRISEIYVAPGQRVEAGDPLLKFEEDSVSDVRRLLESARIDAISEYSEAESEYELSVLEAETTLQTNTAAGSYASSIYSSAMAEAKNKVSLIQMEINQRNANISSLEQKQADAQENYDEALEAYTAAKEGVDYSRAESITDFANAQSRYQNALNALNQAKQNLEDNARAIVTLTNELAAAKAVSTSNQMSVKETYQESVISGENANVTYQAKVESLKETLAETEEKKEQADRRLQDFEAFVGEDGILYAPESGIITAVSYSDGDRLINKGEILSYATAVSMSISVDITQEDVVDVAVGDEVDIYFKAYPDVLYKGSIRSIDTTATARNSNTISYTTVISVLGDTSMLYGGMTADIVFVTERLENVLYISRKAIVEQDGKTYVYKESLLGSRELTEVKTGTSNGIYVEITSGLEEGDVIYLASKVSSAENVQQSDTEQSQSQSEGGRPEGDFQMPGNGQMPEGFEIPGGGQMPGGGSMPEMPGGGQRPGGNGRTPQGFGNGRQQ